MKYDLAASTQLLAVLRQPDTISQATSSLWQLLRLSGERIDNMPPRVHSQLLRALTSGTYACLVDDTSALVPLSESPLVALSMAVERVIPTVRVGNYTDFDTVAARLFQRLKERRAPLEWRMVHPLIVATPQRMSNELLERAFTLQHVMGKTCYATYPVVFTLDNTVACVIQGMYYDETRGLRHITLMYIVAKGFLRLTVMPGYILGKSGHDDLVWMQRGFTVRVGGMQLPPQALMLSEFMWRFTDYRWQRHIAYSATTGAVVEHNSRVLTH